MLWRSSWVSGESVGIEQNVYEAKFFFFFFDNSVSLRDCLFTWGFILPKVNFILQCDSFKVAMSNYCQASNYWNEFHFRSQDWNEIHIGSLKLWHNGSFTLGQNEI